MSPLALSLALALGGSVNAPADKTSDSGLTAQLGAAKARPSRVWLAPAVHAAVTGDGVVPHIDALTDDEGIVARVEVPGVVSVMILPALNGNKPRSLRLDAAGTSDSSADDSEPGIAGVTIFLDINRASALEIVADASGHLTTRLDFPAAPAASSSPGFRVHAQGNSGSTTASIVPGKIASSSSTPTSQSPAIDVEYKYLPVRRFSCRGTVPGGEDGRSIVALEPGPQTDEGGDSLTAFIPSKCRRQLARVLAAGHTGGSLTITITDSDGEAVKVGMHKVNDVTLKRGIINATAPKARVTKVER